MIVQFESINTTSTEYFRPSVRKEDYDLVDIILTITTSLEFKVLRGYLYVYSIVPGQNDMGE